ncbi:DUF2868 domain-containing protein [Nitrogeniibacter aestuarii]|uniref:DUF2868 domain-containing protein n=1 Tax=Nitrogeniibacter aestuarii TaxID=2815343 RepID=UPI001E5F4B6B|nr:DUF2868 domain-containing protein [Nitrogeniibacter aestuarii]
MTRHALTPFEARWLAEATRLREAHVGPLEDAAANRAARAAGGDLEARLCHRALALDIDKGGLRQRLVDWSQQARWAGMVIAILAVLAGTSLGASVLGDGQRPVNVVWALGGLLGIHSLTLIAWFAGLALPGLGHGSLAGRLWLSVTQWLGRRHGDAWLPEAGLSIARRGRMVPAWLGRLSHGMWLLTLTSALITLLVMLSTRRYDFTWETTILSRDVFVGLVDGLGALPRVFGLSMPNADMVMRAAGPDPATGDRQVWSLWLISALILYGVIPRAMLWLWCSWRWRTFTEGFRLDVEEPGHARLARALMPASEGAIVTDAAPGSLPQFRTGHVEHHAGARQLGVALELGPDLTWPPEHWPPTQLGGRLDSRDERRETLDQLSTHPVHRLLVAIDTRLSPDRGSRALMAELSRYTDVMAVWMRGHGARADLWREVLLELGIAETDLFVDENEARQWLEADDE